MNGERYLLDTNVLIGLLKRRQPALEQLETIEEGAVLAYSSVTRMELLGYPSLSADESTTIEDLLAGMERRPLTPAIEDHVIALRKRHRIKLPDAMIAATALADGYTLLTLDSALAEVFRGEIAPS